MRNQQIATILVVAMQGGAGGFLLGRMFPAHNYGPLKESGLFYDTATGKLCDPFKSYHKRVAEDAASQKALEDLVSRSNANTQVPPCD